MKKRSLVIAVLMLILVSTGCGGSNQNTVSQQPTAQATPSAAPTQQETDAPTPSEPSGKLTEYTYRNMQFAHNEAYAITRGETITIEYNGKRAFTTITSVDLSAFSETDNNSLLAKAVSQYLEAYKAEDEVISNHNNKVGGQNAKLATAKAAIEGNTYDMTLITFIDENHICYYTALLTNESDLWSVPYL